MKLAQQAQSEEQEQVRNRKLLFIVYNKQKIEQSAHVLLIENLKRFSLWYAIAYDWVHTIPQWECPWHCRLWLAH